MVTPRWGHGLPPLQSLQDLFDKGKPEFMEALLTINSFEGEFLQVPAEYWNSPSFGGLDVASLYTFISMYQPNVYVEIGSGTSTLVAKLACDRNCPATKIVSIGPDPWANIDTICDEVFRQTLDLVDLKVFKDLEPNDIVFLDGSHICSMNSDVVVFFLEILPVLEPGVIIQIHDILLPYDYFEKWDFLSEQYMLAMYLLYGQDYKIILPNYFVGLDPDLKEITSVQRRGGGSFWFTKTLGTQRKCGIAF